MKRLFCLVLAILMVGSCLVSCNGGDTDVAVDSSADSNTSSAPESAPVEETEETFVEEGIIPAELKEYDLAQFKIVYADDNYIAFAETLRDSIKAKSGVELVMEKDETSGTSGELVLMVGECKRAFSKTVLDYSNTTLFGKVGISCEKGRVQLIGLDRNTLNSSIDYFVENSVNNNSAVLMIPDEGAFCGVNPAKGDTIPKKTAKSTLRVVSNNILLQDILRSTDRATELFSAYMLIDADIFALQEVDMLWHSFYKLDSTMKKMGYKASPENDIYARNPIFYKTEVFELLDSGSKLYDKSQFTDAKYPDSSYNWACLKHKATGEQIIVVSTHLIASVTGTGLSDAEKKEKADNYRAESARQLLAALDELKKTYNDAAVLVMGDFNSNCDSAVYNILANNLVSAREKCTSTKNMNYQTYLGQPLGKEPKKGSDKVIDHVFYDGVDAKHYETLISPYTYAYSDHVPVLFDFKLQ